MQSFVRCFKIYLIEYEEYADFCNYSSGENVLKNDIKRKNLLNDNLIILYIYIYLIEYADFCNYSRGEKT